MSKPILPLPSSQAGSHPEPDPTPPAPMKPTYAKRGKITIVACLPCRRRKTKCDGKRPSCSQCLARDGQCQYDMTDEQRRLTFLRESLESLEAEKSAADSLLSMLQRYSEDDAKELLRILRTKADFRAVARQAHSGRLLLNLRPQSSSAINTHASENPKHGPPVLALAQQPALEPRKSQSLAQLVATAPPVELDEIVRRLRLGEEESSVLASAQAGTLLQTLSPCDPTSSPDVETEFSGPEAFGLVKGAESSVPHESSRDPGAEGQLIDQPWTSVTNETELIEHLLALYFTWQHPLTPNFPEELFRADMASGQTKYCSRLLVNAVCAAGCLFSPKSQERHKPDDPHTTGTDFFDEAISLLNQERTSSLPTVAALSILSHFEGNHGRLSSSWHYSGRSSRMALDLNLHLRSDKTASDNLSPTANIEETARTHVFWSCFVSDQISSFTLGRLPMIPTNAITVDLPTGNPKRDEEKWTAHDVEGSKPGARAATFRQLVNLSKIVNSTLQMFFAPSQAMSGSLLLEEYQKYLQWYAKLPSIVSSLSYAVPHILTLHMYYHAAVLLLFRPFLKAELTDSDISPREICRTSANAISDLFAQHRQLYGLVGIFTFQMHCLLTACTIHIINLPSVSATNHLAFACNSFQDLVKQNAWAAGSLNIIKGLVQKWQIVLPTEVENTLYRNQGDVATAFDFSSSGNDQAEAYRPEKRSMSLNPSTQVVPKRRRITSVESREQPSNYFFSPFPNQPPPLLGPIHTSTSGDVEWNDEVSKMSQKVDGLNFFGDDGFDPFMGYQGD
ncbi:uncharacterized protein K452DRAFT_26023 [Aplosporella prunicola CBS 121167]|uniref:Zn(2)-C6 fungal-type domain-containing protein n=1 Tax=Aplosporella prunicola CBS 121167 TaxID=1176127 RepID=A0A6A6BFI2_9PEZI|nr:uncharacterized protein K452DRAFT_26023 [Aplosporella prunicola CBS 121167]KAF2142065.1 hypothetical protein K452DRAFT_26023 [Aplosporella prunicola CBS 121167]